MTWIEVKYLNVYQVVLVLKNPPANVRKDASLILGLGRSSGEENDYPFLPAVFLPGESHGQRSLAGYTPWDHKTQT